MTLAEQITQSFQHIYPFASTPIVEFHPNIETWYVTLHATLGDDDVPDFRAVVHSDDDGFLYFTTFDPEVEPWDDDTSFVCVRVPVPVDTDD